MTTKRRLQLLPEVLPKPERSGGPSTVRARTLARLGVLAALTATACGGKGDGVVDPLPSPTGGGGGNAGRGGLGGGGMGGSPYGVVDPLPPPATSCEMNGLLGASASYLPDPAVDAGASEFSDAGAAARDAGVDAGSGPLRRVRLYLSMSSGAGIGPVMPPTPNGTLLLDADNDSSTIDLLVRGDTVEIEFGISCRGAGVFFRAVLQLGESSILVTLQSP
jgi:hypothetical protein